ncbi:hypothetical protein HanIR_Chr09g0421591 [Helianthus annuus]|nr:hypothetical protein HanIR_Chr09g0421591 [Helianthus annuus]
MSFVLLKLVFDTGTNGGAQAENVIPTPLPSAGVVLPLAGSSSLPEFITQASVTAAVSCAMSPPTLTAAVTVTASPVSTPLTSSVAPSSLFDSPLSIFSVTKKEMPAVSLAHEATSAGDHAAGDTRGSSSGIAEDGARLGDDLYLPTINWDPNTRDKCYQPQWKIAESSRLIFPQVVQHWVERAYPPAETAYVEGLNNENLMNSAIVDYVSQPRRLTEIRRRWMHDNNELHQARAIIEELKDEKYRLESQLQAAGLRESRFLCRSVMALTVEVEASNAKARAKQTELEEREGQVRELQQRCDSFLSERNALTQSSAARLKEVESALEQANAEVDSLTSQLAFLRGDRNWLITNGLVGALEYLRQSAPFTTLIDRLSAAAYQSDHHNGVYKGYFDCQQSEKIASDFHTARGKFQGDMADALEATYNEPLPRYADLMDRVNEEGIESLRLMLDPAEESGEE